MLLRDLLGGVTVLELTGDPEVDVAFVTHDSRRVRPGALFCCIRGATTDGHDHAPGAAEAGAAALLVERRLALGVTQARVADVRRAIGPVAVAASEDPARAMRTLGVTGTNGKTTTTVLLDAIARAAGDRAAVLGTLSAGAHTTPEAPDLQAELARLRDGGVQTVAMEVSSHALAQHRVDGTWFAAVGFTNLGHDHLDFHHDRESYLEAKARLFTRAFSGRAAVHVADPAGTRLAIRAAAEGLDVLTVALDRADVDVRVTAHGGSGGRPDVVVQHEGDRVCFPAPLLGRFNVENVGVAAALALAGGLTLEAVATGLGRELEVPGRVERIDGGQPFVVLVDYAHTPDALARLLVGTRELCGPGGRVLVVFGCGGDRDRTKRPAMGRAAGDLADVVVVTSDNPRGEDPAAIAAAVVEGLRDRTARWTVDLDRRGAIRTAVGSAAAGDVVVIAGKGHEQGQTAAGVTSPFDDRVVTREVLDTLAEEGRWN